MAKINELLKQEVIPLSEDLPAVDDPDTVLKVSLRLELCYRVKIFRQHGFVKTSLLLFRILFVGVVLAFSIKIYFKQLSLES